MPVNFLAGFDMKTLKTFFISALVVFSACLFVLPSASFASTNDPGQPVILPDFTGTTKAGQKDEITNLQERLGRMLATAFQAVAVLSILPIAVGGLQLISSQGNSERVEKGKKTLFWGVVGLVLALSGVAVFTVLLSILTKPA